MNCSTSVIEIGTKITCTEMQTELTLNDIENILTEKKDLVKETCLRQENDNLRKELEGLKLEEDTFIDKDETVLFYTGLSSWKTLFRLFSYICKHLKQFTVFRPGLYSVL